MLYVRLSPEDNARLKAIAEQMGTTKLAVAKEAIIRHLEDIEDIEEAENRYADILSSKSKTTPLADVMRKFGLET